MKKKQTQQQKTQQYFKSKVNSKPPNVGSFKKKNVEQPTPLTPSLDDTRRDDP